MDDFLNFHFDWRKICYFHYLAMPRRAWLCHMVSSPSVCLCLSVCDVQVFFHTGWNTSKILSRLTSIRFMVGETPSWAIWSNTPKLGLDHEHRNLQSLVGTNRKRICDFLLVRHSNLGPILHRFRDTAGFFVL